MGILRYFILLMSTLLTAQAMEHEGENDFHFSQTPLRGAHAYPEASPAAPLLYAENVKKRRLTKQKNVAKKLTLETIPEELLLDIFTYIAEEFDLDTVYAVRLVNKKLNRIMGDNTINIILKKQLEAIHKEVLEEKNTQAAHKKEFNPFKDFADLGEDDLDGGDEEPPLTSLPLPEEDEKGAQEHLAPNQRCQHLAQSILMYEKEIQSIKWNNGIYYIKMGVFITGLYALGSYAIPTCYHSAYPYMLSLFAE